MPYIKNKFGIKLRYTNRNHLSITKRLKYQKLIKNYKDKKNIFEIENKLSEFNSKTCNFKKFKEYIQNKSLINKTLFDEYKEPIFRKYKWYGFINRKKSETNLIRTIKKTFGEDIIMCYGDWSIGKQMRGMISTPNIGLKRKLAEQFTIYNLDEFRTSILNYKTENKNENLYLPDKKNIPRKIHSILTYKAENNRSECINRDVNAVNNMLKLVTYYLENNEDENNSRPEKFRRNFKLEDDSINSS